jgi:4-amino-4-deoxy-L-arabinose transferase-like glycosyltransferase
MWKIFHSQRLNISTKVKGIILLKLTIKYNIFKMRRWILIVILALGLILRTVSLDKYPSGFTPDEASFGYDAYSILKTGKDQWGHTLPLVLESFGDFKSPLFSYLLIPSVAIGGLSKIAVRLPNAVIGTLAIFATYLLVKELTKKKELALAASFLLSISSWHIMMSRGGFEANLTTLFLPLGIYFLLRGFNNNLYLCLGALTLGLNLFTYHSAKLITPLVLILLIYLFRTSFLLLKRKTLIIASGIFLFFLLLCGYTFLIGGGARVSDVSIFKGSLEAAAEKRMNLQASGISPNIARIFENKISVSLKRFSGNYLSYFSPRFLFTDGPSEYTYGMLPGRGVLYFFELPFLVAFLYSLFKAKEKAVHLFILGWILLSPIPAALASGPGYAGNRAEIMIPAIYMALALGAWELYLWIKNKKFVYAYIILVIFSFGYFVFDYFVSSPAKASESMLYGNLEAGKWLSENIKGSSTAIVSRSLSEPHIYVAFSNKFDPRSYQKASKSWDYKSRGLNWVDQIPEYKLGNYIFKSVHLEEYKNIPNLYLVGRPGEFPDNVSPVKVINYPNGKAALLIVDASEKSYAKAD